MVSETDMILPRYPIYIPSKGRWEKRYTMKALDVLGVPYRVVIQPQDYDKYAAVFAPERLLILPFDSETDGLLRARNWIWEHAAAEGHIRYWQLDDNITEFYKLFNSKRIRVTDAQCFVTTEDFADRYTNVAQAGLQYDMFASQGGNTRVWDKPFLLNTRIYSCTLNLTALPFRYRAAYNDDTDLSLCLLKAGWCTVLICAFMCKKLPTMKVKGGNTDILYAQTDEFDGRFEMAKSLYLQHPDVTKITRKWGRWQHHVDYRRFKNNKLIPVSKATNV